MAKGASGIGGGGGGSATFKGTGPFDRSVTGTNNIKVTGQSEQWESITRTPGSYEILYNDNGTTKRQTVKGYLVEQSGRLFGFTDTDGEDGYTITDIKTGMAIDRTHPKTDNYAIGKSRVLTGKSGYAVKDALLLFGDRMAHNNGLKQRLQQMENNFNDTKKRR